MQHCNRKHDCCSSVACAIGFPKEMMHAMQHVSPDVGLTVHAQVVTVKTEIIGITKHQYVCVMA